MISNNARCSSVIHDFREQRDFPTRDLSRDKRSRSLVELQIIHDNSTPG